MGEEAGEVRRPVPVLSAGRKDILPMVSLENALRRLPIDKPYSVPQRREP